MANYEISVRTAGISLSLWLYSPLDIGRFLNFLILYTYRILVGKPEGKRPLGRPRRRWVDNIKMDLRGIK
jgi:hypothetical protein